MKKIALIFTLCCIATNALAKHPIYIHDKLVKHKDSTFLKLKDYQPQHIDVDYIPQRVVKVQDAPKKLPLQRYVYERGMQYLKYIARAKTQSNAAKKAIELLVRSEPLGKHMHTLLGDEANLCPRDKVVRLYRKIDGSHTGKLLWEPIMTAAIESFKQHVEANISISPNGELLLQNT